MRNLPRCKNLNFAKRRGLSLPRITTRCTATYIIRHVGDVRFAFECGTRDERQVIEESKMSPLAILFLLCVCHAYGQEDNASDNGLSETSLPSDAPTTTETPVGCICGVFLSGQFKKGSKEQPTGNAALLHEHTDVFPCTNLGNKMCTSKCLDVIVKHLPNSPAILCGSIDRDAHKERAYLFIKNCKNEWINTNLSAGREYCCKNGIPYKCPILSR